ncbi:hypothetical protein PRNP1_005972 [Phytophthora ramorum]
MLDRVFAPDLLTKEIKDHVRKYLQFCDVDVDPVLCDYVTELAESIQTSQSVEETRALVLLDEITDANIRADATLALLRSALPPYSPALKSYAHNSARSWKAKRLEEIQEHVRLMEIQDMLTAYDIKRFDIADTKSASRMVSHILNQVSRPTAFTDAMLLVDAYSDLHCDRAVVKFAENLLADSSEDLSDVDTRAAKAIDALSAVKKRMDPKSNAMLTVSIMEEIIEFGVMLLEMEAEGLDSSYHTDKAEFQSEVAPLSFVLRMLEALVAAYLPELNTAMEVAGATENDTLTAYVNCPVFLLSDKLLVDLQTIRRVEEAYGILLSVSALRDPEKCESKLKELMRPEILFADDDKNSGDESTNVATPTVTFVGKARWTLYPRWYRGDSCVLPSYEAMKLATRFAIAEHKNLRREVEARDTIASKRYVSFLVDQRADLLSLQALLSMQELPEDAAIVVNTQMGKLLSTVFQSQDIDNYLALGSMLSMEQKDAFDAFRRQMSRENVAKDFNRFQQLAFVGADAARAWKQIAFLHQCVDLEGNARWWHYLKLLEIKCDHKAFQSERRDLEYIRRLVPALITRSNFDFYTVLEFTRHYQIDDNFPSLVYAESLLLEESATADLEYQDKIAGVIEDIHEQHLVKMLLKSIPKISGQDYDRLLFIFRLLLEHTSYREREEVERRVEVLQNLKVFAAFQVNDYLKTGESKRYQAGNCSSNESETGNKADVEKMSFHQVIANPLEVLARVVTKENFSVLIGLAEPLQLEPDELQMMLLKNMITKNLKQNTLGKCCSPIQFSDFEGILGCLSDTECRVTAAEWLAENFPLGEEKLKALEFALHAALSGANGGEDPSNTSFTGHEALTRLETKILRVKLELLFRNASSQSLSLAEVINDTKQTNQLIALVSDPKKLFKELYRRYALWFCTQHSDTLNTVAKRIAKLLQLPMVKLRLELVREWLVKDAVQMGKNTAKEEDKEDPFELLEEEKLQRSDEDFGKRILYMASPNGELLFAGIPVSNVRSALAQIVSLLQRCPFLDQIDAPAFVIHVRDLTEMAEGEPNGAEIVSQMDLYGFAVKGAMIIPKPVARFEALVRIIRAGAFGSVLQELLDTSCFLDGDQNEMATEDDSGEFADNFRLIQESFSEAAKRKDYSSILATPFEPGFVEYLAATADIDYLLSLLLEDKRMETALNAVELFYEYHPAAAPSLDSTKTGDEDTMGNPDSKRWELIEAYLESSKSAHLERSGDAETMEIGNLVLSNYSEMEGQEDT